MEQFVMGRQLVYKRFPPLSMIPPENLPDVWRPGNIHPEFNNGLDPGSSGMHGYHTATGRTATFGPGGIKFATGFMITPQIVLTAAHVIAPSLIWKNIILFQPAFNGRPIRNLEKVTVRAAFIPTGYFNFDDGKDYAILVLDRTILSEKLFNLSKLKPGSGLNIQSFAIGYPNTPNQQFREGKVVWASPFQVGHSIQSTSGFSGSAITAHQPSDKKDVVVGIHNNAWEASIVSDAMLAEINFVKNNLTSTHLNLFS